MPTWLNMLTTGSLLLAAGCTVWILQDIVRGHAQPMMIMNVVWPITALHAGPLALWAYYRFGRSPGKSERRTGHDKRSLAQSISLSATHCGSGCTLGDILAESLLIVLPLSWFGSELLTSWTLDFIFAFVLGIAFQYFTIRPMSDKSPMQALIAALKADTLSLAAWQVGMYGWMAIATFLIFGHSLDKTGPVFWLMMQIAMLAGFATTWPVNAWLIHAGVKERM